MYGNWTHPLGLTDVRTTVIRSILIIKGFYVV